MIADSADFKQIMRIELISAPIRHKSALSAVAERFNYRIQFSINDCFQVVPAFVDTMVGDAVLREIIGSDFFGTIGRADLLAAVG